MTTYVSTWGNGNNTMELQPAKGEPIVTPKGLLATRAIETKDGWLGQIFVDRSIAWESDGFPDEDSALAAANGRVVERLRAIFGDSLG